MEQTNTSTLANQIEPQYIISVNKFIFLSIFTSGLYSVWWSYKAWQFFKEKENTAILPAVRTIFGVVFLIQLFTKILNFANSRGYQKRYSSTLLFIGYLFVILLSYLPDPLWLVSILAFIFFIPPFRALNFAKLNATDYEVVEQKGFNGRQIFLIVLGSIYWLLMILAIYIFITEQNQYDNY